MTSVLPNLERDLVAAAERKLTSRPTLRPLRRLRMLSYPRRGLWAVFAVACLGTATGALAAAGVFQTGTAVGPNVPPNANALLGVAVPSSVRLLPVAVGDPAGGPAWGLRFSRTTRGLACLQYGRLDDGRIGVLGRDGLFANDGRFHPLSVNYYNQYGAGCADADIHGNAEFNAIAQDVAASGLQNDECFNAFPGTRPAEGLCPFARGPAHRIRPADERLVLYGLLGPDATAISYATTTGAVVTEPTVGRQGAYLIVQTVPVGHCAARGSLGCGNGAEYDTPLHSYGVIRSVTYRDGHTCRMTTPAAICPPVGYAQPPAQHPTAAELRAPIHVHVSYRWAECAQQGIKYTYCQYPQLTPQPGTGKPVGLMQTTVSFIARVAITNVDNDYYVNMRIAPTAKALREHVCSSYDLYSPGPFDQTSSNIRAGQRVVEQLYWKPDCPGTMHGTVALRTATGRTSVFGTVGRATSTPVGTFRFKVP